VVIHVLGKDDALRALHSAADLIGFGTDYHHYRRAILREDSGQAVQKRFTPEFQQRFRGSHTLRLTRGQNQSGDAHLDSAREDSSENTDMDSERQCDIRIAAARRLISAATEMAISSGEMAPISRPNRRVDAVELLARQAVFFKLTWTTREYFSFAADHGHIPG